MNSVEDQAEETAVTLLRQFLSIDTSHPSPDYLEPSFLTEILKEKIFRGQQGGWWSKRKGWGWSAGWSRRWRESPRWWSPGKLACCNRALFEVQNRWHCSLNFFVVACCCIWGAKLMTLSTHSVYFECIFIQARCAALPAFSPPLLPHGRGAGQPKPLDPAGLWGNPCRWQDLWSRRPGHEECRHPGEKKISLL